MPFYPCSEEQQKLIQNFKGGNFGLWYNKYVPLISPQKKYEFCACKPGDKDKDNKEAAADYYLSEYKKIPSSVSRYLEKKHVDQVQYCTSMQKLGFYCFAISVRLKAPLLCGVGHTHPSETSLTFEHNLGIPYIPASSVKGLVRFGYLLNFVRNNMDKLADRDCFNEEEETLVPDMFGIQTKRGKIVFLDAYPVNFPELKLDILNPHYKDYYQNDPPLPPADNQDPIPVRFLTVAPETEFVFRAVLHREIKNEAREQCLQAYKRILTEEGVGSKTSLGYGLFEWIDEKEHPEVVKAVRDEERRKDQKRQEAEKKREQEKLASMSPDDRQIYKIQQLESDPDRISELCQECLEGDFGPKVFIALKEQLQKLGAWNPKKTTKNKSRQEKLQKRNDKIEKRINP